MRKLSKKGKIYAAAATVALVAASGGAAYAYWSTTGSGSGAAANSAGTSPVTLHAAFAAGLAPGNSTSVTYTASNPNSSSTTVTLGTPTVTIDAAHASCDPGWFQVTASGGSTLVPAATVAGPGSAQVGTGTLTMVDLSGTSQDGCKGATVTVSVGSN
ncbi:hypothetical protein AB0323_03170 [Arthrobacter sp. NPDC080031]|uniref:hypothetical protein n=1 Tax=Arthrobacter sp. NPDC080031 TaxID=3155918 RepID=UPI00344E7841